MNRIFLRAALFGLLAAAVPSVPVRAADRSVPPDAGSRAYDLSWTIHVDRVPAGAKVARVWIALPLSLPEQQVRGLAVRTPYPWMFVEDATFHNKVAMVTVARPPSSFAIELAAHVVREPVTGPRRAVLTAKDRALYLRQEALVSLSPRVRSLAKEVKNTNRARYDYVLGSMEYDKTAPGWGHGDTERACDVHKGNCTDFHSLFMSLSRAEGVPAYFEMGYPTVESGESNHEGGYHCWAWFYDEAAKGWRPVDISEAKLDPKRADELFGHLDADRISFSRGRDVVLPGMKGKPLNYLPAGAYAEVDGRPLDQGVTRTISYTVMAGRGPDSHGDARRSGR